MSWFLLKACPKCHGDLASDDGDWLCLQCGTYYYTGLYRNQVTYPAYGANEANKFAWQPEASDQSSAQEDSQAQPVKLSLQDELPKASEKSLVWALGASQAVAVTALERSMVMTNLIPDSTLRPINLETFQN